METKIVWTLLAKFFVTMVTLNVLYKVIFRLDFEFQVRLAPSSFTLQQIISIRTKLQMGHLDKI